MYNTIDYNVLWYGYMTHIIVYYYYVLSTVLYCIVLYCAVVYPIKLCTTTQRRCPCMAINVIVQNNGKGSPRHFTVDLSPYWCMVRRH